MAIASVPAFCIVVWSKFQKGTDAPESRGVRRFHMPGWLFHPWTRTTGYLGTVSRLPVVCSIFWWTAGM